MKAEDFKARRISLVPPLPLKQKIQDHAKGNVSEFIMQAVREKIARIEQASRTANCVSTVLR